MIILHKLSRNTRLMKGSSGIGFQKKSSGVTVNHRFYQFESGKLEVTNGHVQFGVRWCIWQGLVKPMTPPNAYQAVKSVSLQGRFFFWMESLIQPLVPARLKEFELNRNERVEPC